MHPLEFLECVRSPQGNADPFEELVAADATDLVEAIELFPLPAELRRIEPHALGQARGSTGGAETRLDLHQDAAEVEDHRRLHRYCRVA